MTLPSQTPTARYSRRRRGKRSKSGVCIDCDCFVNNSTLRCDKCREAMAAQQRGWREDAVMATRRPRCVACCADMLESPCILCGCELSEEWWIVSVPLDDPDYYLLAEPLAELLVVSPWGHLPAASATHSFAELGGQPQPSWGAGPRAAWPRSRNSADEALERDRQRGLELSDEAERAEASARRREAWRRAESMMAERDRDRAAVELIVARDRYRVALELISINEQRRQRAKDRKQTKQQHSVEEPEPVSAVERRLRWTAQARSAAYWECAVRSSREATGAMGPVGRAILKDRVTGKMRTLMLDDARIQVHAAGLHDCGAPWAIVHDQVRWSVAHGPALCSEFVDTGPDELLRRFNERAQTFPPWGDSAWTDGKVRE